MLEASNPIYLDYHATTPVDPRVLAAMLPYFTQHFGNAASKSHSFGHAAEDAVELARTQVAELIHADASEIFFTSGATESTNLVWQGCLGPMASGVSARAITSNVEHSATYLSAQFALSQGVDCETLSANLYGQVSVSQVEHALQKPTNLVSLIFAQHELGSLNPVESLGRVIKNAGALYHLDGAQALSTVPIDVKNLGVDYLSLSGHKIYAPKGVGVLFIRKSKATKLTPLLHGGTQEQGIRPGTLNVPGIVGFGAACQILKLEQEAEKARLQHLRDQLWLKLKTSFPELILNGHPSERLVHNLHFSIPGLETELLQRYLPEVAFSMGSACSSHQKTPSRILTAVGINADLAFSSVRMSVGRFTRESDIDEASKFLIQKIASLRSASMPSW